MSNARAYLGAAVFDGMTLHQDSALLVANGRIVSICNSVDIPPDCDVESLDGGVLRPGYVDLQVNGGDGILFNEMPTLEGIRRICAAHASFGTTSLLVTLITDSRSKTEAALLAGIAAHKTKLPGFAGLHLEGPHISIAKKGAHDESHIRPMDNTDLNRLIEARPQLPCLKITVAAESVSTKQISRLCEAGIIVSLGHSNATFEQASAAFRAGASCVTHLYNAMSGDSHRQPGLVTAALLTPNICSGLIADGFHVHPAAIRLALAANRDIGRIFLVSDAMATTGTTMDHFYLADRKVLRSEGRLILEDGTLAGADIMLHDAVRFINTKVAVDKFEAIRMASWYPARCIGADDDTGTLEPGKQANFTHTNDQNDICKVWINGLAINNIRSTSS